MILNTNRHLCICAGACLVGIMLYERPKGIWWFVCAVLSAGILYEWKQASHRKRRPFVAVLFVLFALLGFSVTACQSNLYQRHLSALQSMEQVGSSLQIQGTVYRKTKKADSYQLYLKHSKCVYQNRIYEPGNLLIYCDKDVCPVGSEIMSTGEVDHFDPATNDGEFDSVSFYRAQNIVGRFYATEIQTKHVPKLPIREWCFQFQQRISSVYETELNDRDAGVLSTMVVGNKALLDSEVRSTYQAAGISHILAISGLHISILGYGLFRFLRRMTLSFPASAIISFLVVLCFAYMSGMGVTALRALLMYAVIMGSAVSGRVYDGINSLSIAALILLVYQPLSLFQSGFLFSFTAMICILMSTAMLHKSYEELLKENDLSWWRKRGKRLLRRVMSGLMIQLWMLPLTAYFYYEVPMYGLFLNMLVLPLCSWLLALALAGGIMGMVSVWISKWLLVSCHLILEFYQRLIEIAALLPGDHLIVGRPPKWFLLLYYTALVAAMLWAMQQKQQKKARSILGIGVCASMLLAYLILPFPTAAEVDFLDVGQGDGIYITDGQGTHIMIDGGSTTRAKTGTYVMVPFLKYHRVDEVDAWIVTHTDQDHISGMIEAIEADYPIRQLIFSRTLVKDQTYQNLVHMAEEHDITVSYASAGNTMKLGGMEMQCLFPGEGDTSADTNDTSLVWLLTDGDYRMLFTGDIGKAQEQLLLKRGLLTRIQVLKCAHHGSKYSSCQDFLEAVKPAYTVISAGRGNTYGHPHAETLERLQKYKSVVLLTQEQGQIRFRKKHGKWLNK